MNSVSELKDKVDQHLSAYRDAMQDLDKARTLLDNDPVDYLGRLVYENKRSGGGAYGYGYGEYGKPEKDRAQEVLDIVGGDIGIAERVIVKLRIR